MLQLESLVYRKGDLWLEASWLTLLELSQTEPLNKTRIYKAARSVFQLLAEVEADAETENDIAELCRGTVEYLLQ